MIGRFISVLVATTALVIAFVGPALAQTNSASAPPAADRCATVSAALQQLPATPDAMASSMTPASPDVAAPTTYTDAVVAGRGIEVSAGQIVGDARTGAAFVGDVVGRTLGAVWTVGHG